MTLDQIARKYAAITGCDEATASQAAFVAGALLATLAGDDEVGDYFTRRAADMEDEIEFAGYKTAAAAISASYEEEANHGWY